MNGSRFPRLPKFRPVPFFLKNRLLACVLPVIPSGTPGFS
ncbi:hypothetical protein HMPREF3038_00182 [Akkermansia sp. KLE1797]|nr:hypothetical protein HMPREF3038_00182 [Akkermansia sp. KLE1797]KXU53253.1 hypothetical protein HMPREF3039_02584 [Akkermansia sp. KLE1798]KZA05821.1 hypothetical protein HMPREF1326_00485 [Akkermansia sp. KLE1605]